jgi:hypothetical protein
MTAEEIGLFDAPSTGFYLLDRVEYNSQTTDYSSARSTDGGMEWIIATSPTPERTNNISSRVQAQLNDKMITVYPNPVSGERVYFNIPMSVNLIDIYGKLLIQGTDQNYLSIGSLPPGIYILQFCNGESVRLIRQ